MADQSAIDRVLKSLHWLGHDCFRLDSPAGHIYFDPFQLAGGPTAALILCSHEHFDHCVPEDIAKINGPQTVIVTEASRAKRLGASGLGPPHAPRGHRGRSRRRPNLCPDPGRQGSGGHPS